MKIRSSNRFEPHFIHEKIVFNNLVFFPRSTIKDNEEFRSQLSFIGCSLCPPLWVKSPRHTSIQAQLPLHNQPKAPQQWMNQCGMDQFTAPKMKTIVFWQICTHIFMRATAAPNHALATVTTAIVRGSALGRTPSAGGWRANRLSPHENMGQNSTNNY